MLLFYQLIRNLAWPQAIHHLASSQIRAQPPIDPLHWTAEHQPLGERQPPWAFRVGGIHQHRAASFHAGLDQPWDCVSIGCVAVVLAEVVVALVSDRVGIAVPGGIVRPAPRGLHVVDHLAQAEGLPANAASHQIETEAAMGPDRQSLQHRAAAQQLRIEDVIERGGDGFEAIQQGGVHGGGALVRQASASQAEFA